MRVDLPFYSYAVSDLASLCSLDGMSWNPGIARYGVDLPGFRCAASGLRFLRWVFYVAGPWGAPLDFELMASRKPVFTGYSRKGAKGAKVFLGKTLINFHPFSAGLAPLREFVVDLPGFRFAASGLRSLVKQWHECPVFVKYPSYKIGWEVSLFSHAAGE